MQDKKESNNPANLLITVCIIKEELTCCKMNTINHYRTKINKGDDLLLPVQIQQSGRVGD